MALQFVNVKTGEKRICRTEPMIAAHINSSDRNPNATQGQDRGWRISPETVIELERIKNNRQEMQFIASTFGMLMENIAESDILTYISMRADEDGDDSKTGQGKSAEDFQRAYEDDVRRLREEDARREAEKKPGEKVETADEDATPVDLKGMKRAELNAYAETVGIESPSDYSNADKLIEAIKAKEGEEV